MTDQTQFDAEVAERKRRRMEAHLATMTQRPIGSRYYLDGDIYTLVSYSGNTSSSYLLPWFICDDVWDDNPEPVPTLYGVWGLPDLLGEARPDWPHTDITMDPEIQNEALSRRALKHATHQPLRNTFILRDKIWAGQLAVPTEPVFFATARSIEEVEAVWDYAISNREYVRAEQALTEARYQQAVRLNRVAHACGTQTRGAQLVGVDQSTVSRAVKAAGGSTD